MILNHSLSSCVFDSDLWKTTEHINCAKLRVATFALTPFLGEGFQLPPHHPQYYILLEMDNITSTLCL